MDFEVLSEGNNLKEATEEALKKLGVEEEEAKIEILEKDEATERVKIRVIVENRLSRGKVFLNEILKRMDIKAEIKIEKGDDYTYLNIVNSPYTGLLIGVRGQTLDALQAIVNIAVNKEEKEWEKIIVDVEGYRQRRKATLEAIAIREARRALESKSPVELEPMNAYDRRIIHLALKDRKDIVTTSHGEEPQRYIVISPKE